MKTRKNRCLWREGSFLLTLIQQTILPRLGLQACLYDWDDISTGLCENSRERTLQLTQLDVDIGALS